jgi:hypothetical protein
VAWAAVLKDKTRKTLPVDEYGALVEWQLAAGISAWWKSSPTATSSTRVVHVGLCWTQWESCDYR